MLAIDKDLRHRGAAAGAPGHLVASCRLLDDVDFGIGDALALQQHPGARAIGAKHRRIKLDLSHYCGYSEIAIARVAPVFQLRRQCRGSKFRAALGGNYPPTRNARARVNTATETA